MTFTVRSKYNLFFIEYVINLDIVLQNCIYSLTVGSNKSRFNLNLNRKNIRNSLLAEYFHFYYHLIQIYLIKYYLTSITVYAHDFGRKHAGWLGFNIFLMSGHMEIVTLISQSDWRIYSAPRSLRFKALTGNYNCNMEARRLPRFIAARLVGPVTWTYKNKSETL